MNSETYFKNFFQESSEPFYEDYKEILLGLTDILIKHDLVEGNIFGYHNTDPSTYPREEFKNKRRNIALFSLTKNNILEVGFNAGHSALLILTANPNVKYTAIDIARHGYTHECYKYLKSIFLDRIDLITGNSLYELPKLLEVNSTFDGYIIDGDHNADIAFSDISVIVQNAKDGSILCFDDSDLNDLRILLDFFMLKGYLVPITDEAGFLKSTDHMFFRITK
jgi:hypothetical protein